MCLNETLEKIKECFTLVIGDLMIDRYIFCSSNRVSPEAPVLIAKTDKTEEKLGGAGNVAENILSLNAPVILIGIAGNDSESHLIESILTKRGFYDHLLIKEEQRATTVKSRIISHSQQLLRLDSESTHEITDLSINKIISFLTPYKQKIKNIILSDYNKGLLTEKLINKIKILFSNESVNIFADPKGNCYKKYTGITCITPNEKEAVQASGILIKNDESLHEAGKKLIEALNLKEILITRSEKGMFYLNNKGESFSIKSHAKEVFDVTGAGDTVISIYSLFRSSNAHFSLSCEASSAGAGIVISKLGASSVTQEELNNELQKNTKKTPKKLISRNKTTQLSKKIKESNKTIVFTNGCFDLLHAGHVDYLSKSKAFGDILIIGINSDYSIKKLKGDKRPLLNETDRVFVLSALDCVDYIVIFDEDTPELLLKELKPDILTKGADYKVNEVVGNDFIGEWGGKVELVPLTENQSTTGLIQKIVERYSL